MFVPVIPLETIRESFVVRTEFDEFNASVDLDDVRELLVSGESASSSASGSSPPFSFSLCEVEVTGAAGASVDAARATLDKVVGELGLQDARRGYSKVYEYLRFRLPHHPCADAAINS